MDKKENNTLQCIIFLVIGLLIGSFFLGNSNKDSNNNRFLPHDITGTPGMLDTQTGSLYILGGGDNKWLRFKLVFIDCGSEKVLQNTIKYGSKIIFYNPKNEERESIGNKIALETGKRDSEKKRKKYYKELLSLSKKCSSSRDT